jgi:hypothetical protein
MAWRCLWDSDGFYRGRERKREEERGRERKREEEREYVSYS